MMTAVAIAIIARKLLYSE